jgi:hypothetical protein
MGSIAEAARFACVSESFVRQWAREDVVFHDRLWKARLECEQRLLRIIAEAAKTDPGAALYLLSRVRGSKDDVAA